MMQIFFEYIYLKESWEVREISQEIDRFELLKEGKRPLC